MKKLTIAIFLVLGTINVFGQGKQYHVQVRPTGYDCNLFQIFYTNDNWKTERNIREFAPDYTVTWYPNTVGYDEAVFIAKKFKTWQSAENHNRIEYQKSLRWLKANPQQRCCRTKKNIINITHEKLHFRPRPHPTQNAPSHNYNMGRNR